jgi:hypothetical protein
VKKPDRFSIPGHFLGCFGGAFWKSWGGFGWFFLLRRSFWVVFFGRGGGWGGGGWRVSGGEGAGTTGAGRHPRGGKGGRGGKRHGTTRAVGRRGTARATRWGVGPCEKRTRQGETIAEVEAPKKNCGSRGGRRGKVRAGTGAATPCVGRGGVGGGDGRRGGRQRGPLGRGGSTTGRKVTERRRGGGGAVEGRLGVLGSGFDGLSGCGVSLQRRSNPLGTRKGEFKSRGGPLEGRPEARNAPERWPGHQAGGAKEGDGTAEMGRNVF